MSRFTVTIDDNERRQLPVRLTCDSVVALLETGGQAAFSTRGLNEARMAQHGAAILVRLFEMNPAALAMAIVLIRRGQVGGVGAGRDASTGKPLEVDVRDPNELAEDVLNVIRAGLEMDISDLPTREER